MVTALVFLMAFGALPAIALTRNAIGLTVAPAVVLVLSALGASLATALGVSVVRVIVALAIIANLAAAIFIYKQSGGRRAADQVHAWFGDLSLVVWFSIPSLLLLALYPGAPLGWDARSIWWFHASWFQSGGEVVRRSLANPVLSFSQSDYPAGNPAAIATLWRLTGGKEDLYLAQAATAVMTALAIACLALILVHSSRNPTQVAASTVLVAAASHMGQGFAAYGYVDVLSAALVVTSLVAHLCVHDPRLGLVVGSVALAGASVTKNEGIAFGVMVLVIAVLATRNNRFRVASWGACSLLPAAFWSLIVRVNISDQEISDAPVIDSGLWDRLLIAVPAITREVYLILGSATAVFAILALALVQAMRRGSEISLERLVPAGALLVAGVLTAFISSLVYASGEYELSWWFATSLERVSVTPKLFALAGLVTMVPLALELKDWAPPGTLVEPVAAQSQCDSPQTHFTAGGPRHTDAQ